MGMGARLAMAFTYGQVLDAAYAEDMLSPKERREAKARSERVLARVDGWLYATPEEALEEAKASRRAAVAMLGGEVG